MRPRAFVALAIAAFVPALLAVPLDTVAAKPQAAPVTDAAVAIRCDDSLTVLNGRRISLSFDVSDAAYDPGTRTLYASCQTVLPAATSINSLQSTAPLVKRQLVAYSLEQRAITREFPSEWRPIRMLGRRLFVRNDTDVAILDPATGEVHGESRNNEALLVEDTLFVIRSGDEIVRLDPESGVSLWRRKLQLANRASAAIVDSGSLFVIGDGLAVLGQADGAGWELETATRRSDVASRIANVVLVAATAPVTGRFAIPEYWGVRLDDLCSLPLVRDDYVYFAADTLVMSLRRDNGLAQWTRRLGGDSFDPIRRHAVPRTMREPEPELPGHLLVRDGGTSLAVITTGYAPNGVRVWRADPPSIALLDPLTGETRARTRITETTVAHDYRHVRGGHLVLTPRKLVLYDDALKTLATILPPTGTRAFVGFEPDPARLLVRTNAGLLALDSDSLTVRWERRVGGGVSAAHGVSTDRRSWWIGHTALLAIPADDTSAPLLAPIRSARAHIDNGVAVALDGRNVTVVALPGERLE